MDKLNKEIRELVQNIKSNDKDLEEEILFNTIKIYSQNQNQIDQFIEKEFVKKIMIDEDYDNFDFEYLIPLPQKISEKWVKSRLEFSDSNIVVMRKKQDGYYFFKSYFYFIHEEEKFLVSALIHKDEVVEFSSEY